MVGDAMSAFVLSRIVTYHGDRMDWIRHLGRLVGSAHVLGNYCGTVPTQVGHHLHGRTTRSIIRTVGHPGHMCDTVRDGQSGHDFRAAVGKVAEVDSTQPRGPGG